MSDDAVPVVTAPRRRVPWVRLGAEFLTIFAGVTLSLVADDWRTDREDRRQETTLLEALHHDLAADAEELERVHVAMVRWDSWAAKLHARSRLPQFPADSVNAVFRPVLFYNAYRPVAVAYVSLKEGGQIALIRDPALRAAITDYYEVHQDYMKQFYGLVMDTYLIWRRTAFKHVEVAPARETGTFWPIDEFRFATSWAEFASDPDVRPALTDLGIMGGNFAARIEAVLMVNRELRDLLTEGLDDA